MEKNFQFLEHTADIKFQAFGSTKEQMFENAALAMFNSMSDEKIKTKIKKTFDVEGKDNEALMYNFLEELLFLFDSEHFFLSTIKVKLQDKKLIAECEGDLAKNYDIKIDIKAITYNEMFIKQEANKWITQVVLDV